jgi:transcriptional regulator with XRE-family HTH domain
MDEKRIARNIKRIRQSKRMSLGLLAELTGLTKGYISKIENSDKAPKFSTLVKIANAVGTDISLLLADESESPEDLKLCIVREDERKEIVSKGPVYGFRYEALAFKKTGKNMDPYIIQPAFREKGIFSHDGEEFIHVLEGTYQFVYNGNKNILKAGDSVYFDSIVPHTGSSLGRKRAKVLAIVYSYKRNVSFLIGNEPTEDKVEVTAPTGRRRSRKPDGNTIDRRKSLPSVPGVRRRRATTMKGGLPDGHSD